jgi:hypothetical protein
VCRPYGTRFYFPPDPGLPPWAKLFRPAGRDWRIGQEDAEQIDKLGANKIPTLAKSERKKAGPSTALVLTPQQAQTRCLLGTPFALAAARDDRMGHPEMGHPVIYGFAGEGFAITAPASVYSLVHE